MMELPFNVVDILKHIDREPGVLLAFAAFHPIVLAVIVLIPLSIFKKIGIYTPKPTLGAFGFCIVVIMAVGWLLGFVSQILLFFMGVPGLKLLLIYISMYLCISAFAFFNIAPLQKKFNSDQLKKAV